MTDATTLHAIADRLREASDDTRLTWCPQCWLTIALDGSGATLSPGRIDCNADLDEGTASELRAIVAAAIAEAESG